MAGYHNYSMSNNAVEAYYTGEKPISKWKKSDIISEINQYRKEFDLPLIDNAIFKKISIKIMRKHFLRCSSCITPALIIIKQTFIVLTKRQLIVYHLIRSTT